MDCFVVNHEDSPQTAWRGREPRTGHSFFFPAGALAAMIVPEEGMEDRLTTLEVRYTHLERQVEELNQLLFEQQKMIDRLTREIASLRARAAGVDSGPSNEPPPHY